MSSDVVTGIIYLVIGVVLLGLWIFMELKKNPPPNIMVGNRVDLRSPMFSSDMPEYESGVPCGCGSIKVHEQKISERSQLRGSKYTVTVIKYCHSCGSEWEEWVEQRS